jgi:hypothetical protein
MKRIAAAALLVGFLAVSAGASTAASTAPHVRITARSPAAVAGTSFRPSERVAVTLSSDDLVLRKTAVADRLGRFSIRWLRSLPNACHGAAVVAVGSKGSRAAAKLPAVECAPLQPTDR